MLGTILQRNGRSKFDEQLIAKYSSSANANIADCANYIQLLLRTDGVNELYIK